MIDTGILLLRLRKTAIQNAIGIADAQGEGAVRRMRVKKINSNKS